MQQGDPLGPFLFSLSIIDHVKSCKSRLNIWFLDDGTLGGPVNQVYEDYKMILDGSATLGPEVNPNKCELFLINPKSEECKNALVKFNNLTPGVILKKKENLTLLGAPIFPEAIENVLESKLENLTLMATRIILDVKVKINHQFCILT